MSYQSYFVGKNDAENVVVAKLAKINRVALAADGSTTVSDTSATTPPLGAVAWGLIRATSATVVSSLTSVNPATLVTETITPSLASGEKLVGYFTAITLTSGSVVCNNISSTESAPVPLCTVGTATPHVADDKLLDITFTVSRASGGFPPNTTEVWKKTNSGSYSLLATVTDDNGVFSYTDASLAASNAYHYKARYASGTSKGAYSAEIVPTPDLPVDTLGTGTWVHASLTGGMTVTIPAGSLAADYVEIWGFADAAAVVANGALTLLATVHPSIDGATTYVYTKVYTALDDASSKTLKFQARHKRGTAYGVRSAVLSVTAVAP